ncbi:MAG: amino acid permease [Gemmatimonadetes bacterium]|nr:amino acid permease [Gemmatimonadota bacterium]
MTQLKRTLRTADGLAMVVGIMVGSGIFRTPGIIAGQLGRPLLTFVAWVLGGALAFLGALVFAELATRFPQAGGKYVYAREAFGRRAAFVVGWVEALGIYAAAIAAIGTVGGEYVGRLLGLPAGSTRWLGVGCVALFTAINLVGVASGRWVQNVVTAAKVLALAGVVVLAFAGGSGAGWSTSLATAPRGAAQWGALALAFQSVIWTYYGYPDAAKIAEEVVDPSRTLPRVFLLGIAGVIALYLLLNAAFLHVLPLDRIAASNLVAGDAAEAIFGARGGTVMAALALLVVLASLNGNVFVTPRVIFGLARDGLGPGVFARVNPGGTPWAAMLLVGAVAIALAATGTFERLLSLAITLILVVDGAMVLALFRLRARQKDAPFLVPLYPFVPLVFVGVYAALFVGTALKQPGLVAVTVGVLGVVYVVGMTVRRLDG